MSTPESTLTDPSLRSGGAVPTSRHDLAPLPPEPGAPASREVGGPTGPEPTRFGDWEKAGRCIDF